MACLPGGHLSRVRTDDELIGRRREYCAALRERLASEFPQQSRGVCSIGFMLHAPQTDVRHLAAQGRASVASGSLSSQAAMSCAPNGHVNSAIPGSMEPSRSQRLRPPRNANSSNVREVDLMSAIYPLSVYRRVERQIGR